MNALNYIYILLYTYRHNIYTYSCFCMFLLGIHEHVWTKTLRHHSTWKQSCNSLALMGLFFRPRCASINQSRLVIANVYTNSASKRCCMIVIFPIGEKRHILPGEMLVFEKVGSIQLRMDICPLWLVGCQFPVQSLCIYLKCSWADCELKDSSIS